MPAAEAVFTVSELARTAGVPVPRIKFYLRERLLPAANLRAKKRAFYDARHLQRLRLIHVLRQIAGLSVPAIRELCGLLDRDRGGALPLVIARVIDALGHRARSPRGGSVAEDRAQARRELLAMLGAHGVRVRAQARAIDDLANALLGLRQVIGPDLTAQAFVPYLEAMCRLAEQDFERSAHLLGDRTDAALLATLGTVLWEPVLLLLRRVAHEHVAAQRLAPARRAAARRAR